MYSFGIITASDKGAIGKREDISGKTIQNIMESNGYKMERYVILPDEKDQISRELITMSDERNINVILTTGGTGFAKRDVTPEATKAVLDKEVPGIAEAIRSYSLGITKRAMLSRAVSGIRGNSLIINLPGSPKAVEESLLYIIEELKHGLDILSSNDSECAR